jgi:hypothetical protein
LKFAEDLLDGFMMYICRYRSVNRRFDAVAEAVSPKSVFETVIVVVTAQYLMCFETNFGGTSLMAKR